MPDKPDAPLIVQGDQSILLDLHAPEANQARKAIVPFAELEKSPEHIHSYRLSSLSLWNAAAAGYKTPQVIARLEQYSRYALPSGLEQKIQETMSRYGMISLVSYGDEKQPEQQPLLLEVHDAHLFDVLKNQKKIQALTIPSTNTRGFLIHPMNRGRIKQELIQSGYPVEDLIPLRNGAPCEMELRENVQIRDYQSQAAESFLGNLEGGTGYGTIVLPCGSGKTVVGIDIMSRLKTECLILCPNVSALHQWKRELLDKTTLNEDDIGEYSAQKKEIRPVTVSTYQILIWRPNPEAKFPHFDLITRSHWGLIIYDEVHLLPAPVFRMTIEVQTVRRLGLTATLVREDGKEREVFSLVGPKRFDVPWKDMEAHGWISQAICKEIRVELPDELHRAYALADKRRKYRVASENPKKFEVLDYLIHHHGQDQILVIGQYLKQLHEIQKRIDAPIITGQTAVSLRDELYDQFRNGDIRILIVSKVANFAIDLPDASVAIQVSGSFGSRQEEAQRLGRILRPKDHSSYFYSLISRYTVEEEFGINRQKFLAEQGYAYQLELWEDG